MRILDQYLVRSFLSAFIYCIVFFTVLFVIIDAFNNLADFLRNGTSMKIILMYYANLFPVFLVQVAPIATLVSLLFVLGNLSKNNEVAAFKASGISSFQLLTPYFFLGTVISAGVLLVSEIVVPYASITSTAIMQGLIEKGGENLSERSIKNVTLYGKHNRIMFAREYVILSKTLYDIVILEDRPNQVLQSKLIAKKGRYRDGHWIFYEAIKYELDDQGEILGEPVFSEEMIVDIPERPEEFLRQASQVQFMSAKQLKDYIHHLKGTSSRLTRRLWVDFHYKIAFPFISFIVMLTGAPLAMRVERGSAMVGVGTSLIVVTLYYGLASVCLALGKGGVLPPFLSAWFGNILFGGIGLVLIRRSA